LAAVAEAAPRVPWEDFRETMGWRSGEHVGMIGPTGQGKTTLMHAILDILLLKKKILKKLIH
jgi:ABC-type Mn2+/Zn2+ transport system ATPase subunit